MAFLFFPFERIGNTLQPLEFSSHLPLVSAMSKPQLDANHPPTFKDKDGLSGLRKKNDGKKHKATITGSNIAVGDIVFVSGTDGDTRQTIWLGTIKKDNRDGTYLCENLTVIQEQQKDKKPVHGTEDVSTTVTNPDTGTSAPVVSKAVIIIP